ncbi:MAG TPA: hypothetical protein VKP69_13925, partial [Isosphaeraceae bacterium]|nr:hypothetical protein [Isosphaeraceae bacterium]
MAASSWATHLQAASTKAVRSRALDDRISPPSWRVCPLWRTIGARPIIFHLAVVVEPLWLGQFQPEGHRGDQAHPGHAPHDLRCGPVPLGLRQLLQALGHPLDLLTGVLQFVKHHVQAEPQLRQQLQPPQRLDRPLRPGGQAVRLGDTMLEQERLDRLRDRPGLAD